MALLYRNHSTRPWLFSTTALLLVWWAWLLFLLAWKALPLVEITFLNPFFFSYNGTLGSLRNSLLFSLIQFVWIWTIISQTLNSISFHNYKIMFSNQNMNLKQIKHFKSARQVNFEHSKQTKTALCPAAVHEDQSDWHKKTWLDDL